MDNLKDKKILILGFSKTGTSAARYFLNKGAKVFISEQKEKDARDTKKIEELTKLGAQIEFGGHSDEFICDSAFCILSPSVPTNAPILEKLEERNIEYLSDLEYLSRIHSEKMVLITGTNGKTTTTALISHLLSTKFKAPSCGNIGVSPFEYLDEEIDYFVVEASSFQLHYSNTINPKVSIFCNLTPDHILWHKTLENYFSAKAKPFRNAKANDIVILNFDDEWVKKLNNETEAKKINFSLKEQKELYLKDNKIFFNNNEIIDTTELQIVGPHNIQNAMCAIGAAMSLGLTIEETKEGLKTFRSIEHRLEYIRTIEDTDYYNDSKATNPEASVVAINSFKNKKVVLIAGGRDKKTTLEEFIRAVKEKISKVVLIGEATQRFKNELFEQGYMNIVNSKTLEEAIDIASLDKPDVVLLSPACASFDMFESYEKRGEAFKKYVLSKK